jgi:hypothetical protein
MRGGVARLARAGSLALSALLVAAATALAVDPTATPAGGGNVRTNPAATGLAGDPLFALLGVAVVGLLAAAVTLAAVRLTERR